MATSPTISSPMLLQAAPGVVPSVNAARRSALSGPTASVLIDLPSTGDPDRDAYLAQLNRQANQVYTTTKKSVEGVFGAAWRGAVYGAGIGSFVGLFRLGLPSVAKTIWERAKQVIGRPASPNYNFSIRGALLITGLLTLLGGVIGASAQGVKRTKNAFQEFENLNISLDYK